MRGTVSWRAEGGVGTHSSGWVRRQTATSREESKDDGVGVDVLG